MSSSDILTGDICAKRFADFRCLSCPINSREVRVLLPKKFNIGLIALLRKDARACACVRRVLSLEIDSVVWFTLCTIVSRVPFISTLYASYLLFTWPETRSTFDRTAAHIWSALRRFDISIFDVGIFARARVARRRECTKNSIKRSRFIRRGEMHNGITALGSARLRVHRRRSRLNYGERGFNKSGPLPSRD